MAEEFDIDSFDFDDAIIVTPEASEEIEETNEESVSQNQETATVVNNTTTSTEEEDSNLEEEESEESSNSGEKVNFTGLAKFYAAQGKIKDFDEKDFDGSWEALDAMLQEAEEERVLAMLNDYKSTLQPITKRIEDLLEAGVPQEDVINHMKDVKSLSKISKDELTSNEDVQKAFLKQYFKETTSFNDKKIDNLIKLKLETGDTEDLPELYDDYSKILSDKEKEMQRLAEEADQAEEQKVKNTVESINKYIDESKEFLGVKLSPQLKEQIRKEFKTVKLPTGEEVNPIMAERAKNPVAFDFAVRVCNALGLLKIDEKTKQWQPDMSKLKVNMTSKVTKELAETFGNGKNIRTGAALTNLGSNGTLEETAKELAKMFD